MFYYTDGDSRGPEDFTARIALIEPEQAAPEVKDYEQKLKGKPGCVQKPWPIALRCARTSSDFTPVSAARSIATGLANLTNRFTDPLGLELEMPEEKI